MRRQRSSVAFALEQISLVEFDLALPQECDALRLECVANNRLQVIRAENDRASTSSTSVLPLIAVAAFAAPVCTRYGIRGLPPTATRCCGVRRLPTVGSAPAVHPAPPHLRAIFGAQPGMRIAQLRSSLRRRQATAGRALARRQRRPCAPQRTGERRRQRRPAADRRAQGIICGRQARGKGLQRTIVAGPRSSRGSAESRAHAAIL